MKSTTIVVGNTKRKNKWKIQWNELTSYCSSLIRIQLRKLKYCAHQLIKGVMRKENTHVSIIYTYMCISIDRTY